MSVTVRTNRATNPSVASAATNWAHVAGTGGTATGVRNGGVGYSGAGFFRVAWTVATSALSGGFSYTQTGLSAATQYSHQVFVRSSKTQTVRMSVQYKDSSSVDVGSAFVGSDVALTANVWEQVKVEAATSGAGVDRAVVSVEATTGGALWANGDTFDGDLVMIETGPVCTLAFDGSFTDSGSTIYAWTGPENASTSTATLYIPVLALVHHDDFDRVEITITDLTPTANVINIWRTADGKRAAVRESRRREVVGSDFVTDYEPPLKRLITYELEVLSGVSAQVAAPTADINIPATSGWIQDPLQPTSAIRLYDEVGPGGEPALQHEALKKLEYAAGVSIIPILGSPDPVAILGQRLAASGITYAMVTDVIQQATNLRNLMLQAPLLVIRPLPEWSSALPGVCYCAPPLPSELPVNEAWGGGIIEWKFDTPLVAAPTMRVLVALWTYGDLKAVWATYQQAQTAYTGDTYLDVAKNPPG